MCSVQSKANEKKNQPNVTQNTRETKQKSHCPNNKDTTRQHTWHFLTTTTTNFSYITKEIFINEKQTNKLKFNSKNLIKIKTKQK